MPESFPITLWDERFSTSHIKEKLREEGKDIYEYKQSGMLDNLSAKDILDEFLDFYDLDKTTEKEIEFMNKCKTKI